VALLSFPASPINGELYPVAPIAGQNQYQWEATTSTWRLVGTATGVSPGIYGDVNNIPQITIDATGKITIAANIPIGSTYVRTNNVGAYNSYIWPNADGTASDFLSTDGAGNLVWQAIPFTNYWKLTGTTLFPSTDGKNLALTDSLGNITFFSDVTTSETDFVNGATAVVISPDPVGTSTITVSGGGNIAQPLGFLGSDYNFQAYGNSYLNTPSTLTFTQTLLETSTSFNSASSITANSGTVNSITTPPTRGTAGQILITNGDGTTTWITNPEQGYWARAGSNIYPENPGDNVQVRSLANITTIDLKSDGNAYFIEGNQNLQIDPGYATGEVEIRVNDFPGAGIVNLDAEKINLRAYGTVYTNPPVQFEVDYTSGIKYNAIYLGVRRDLFTVDLDGTLIAGLRVNPGYPAFSVEGTNGNTVVAGTLRVNGGVASSPTPQFYEFPNNRGVNGYVLTTDGAGGTQWQSASVLSGYWSQSISTLDIYPTLAGQNVVVRDATSTNSIELLGTGIVNAYGGTVLTPTFGIGNFGTGMSGNGLNLYFSLNGVEIAGFDNTEFHSANDIRITGAATNSSTDATIKNTNDDLIFSASSNVISVKNILFEIAPGVVAGTFTNTLDFTVTSGNAAIGSSGVVTYIDSLNLSVGNIAANEAGLLKFVSLFNGGDGVELTQDESTGDFEVRMDHAALPVVTVNATDTDLATTLTVVGDTTLQNELFLPSPTVPLAATSPGLAGQISWDVNYIYICVSTNTWKRTPISTW
jgi:hypothetical protein